MLELLRKNSRSFIVYLMFAIIIVVFAFTFGAITPGKACNGGGGPGGYSVADLVVVNGDAINSNLLNMVDELSYSPPAPHSKSPNAADAERYYRQTRYGQLGLHGPFSGVLFSRPPSEVSPIKVVKILDEMVETKLMSDYARELGMSITNEEMSARLSLLVDSFKDRETGKFDEKRWLGFLRNQLNTTPSAFEGFVKDELLRERVIQLLVGGMGADESEVARRHRLTEEKVKVEYIAIDKRRAKPLIDVSDAEVKTWLAANQDAAKEKYDKIKAIEFTTPKRWTLRGIKLEAVSAESNDATDEQKAELKKARAEVKTRADALKAEIAAAIAKADAAAPAPTDTNTTAPGAALSPAQVFGGFALTQSDDAATKASGGLFPAPLDTKTLARPPFGVPVITAVSALEEGKLSEVVELDDGFWIFFTVKIDEAVTTPYADAAMDVARDMIRDEKAEAALGPLADEVLAAAKADPTKSLADAAKAVNAKHKVSEDEGLRVAEAMPFARLSSFGPGYPLQLPYIFGIGKSPELVRAAFSASAEAPLLDKVFTVEPDDKRVVARYLETIAAPELDEDKAKELTTELTLDEQRTFYRAWYDDYLTKKKMAGEVTYTDAWAELRNRAIDAYRSSGGVLPNDAPTTPKATADAKAAAGNETAKP